MSNVVGVGKKADDELGVYYIVTRKRGDHLQKWANTYLEESANQIAEDGNARSDGWTYEVRRTRV